MALAVFILVLAFGALGGLWFLLTLGHCNEDLRLDVAGQCETADRDRWLALWIAGAVPLAIAVGCVARAVRRRESKLLDAGMALAVLAALVPWFYVVLSGPVE